MEPCCCVQIQTQWNVKLGWSGYVAMCRCTRHRVTGVTGQHFRTIVRSIPVENEEYSSPALNTGFSPIDAFQIESSGMDLTITVLLLCAFKNTLICDANHDPDESRK